MYDVISWIRYILLIKLLLFEWPLEEDKNASNQTWTLWWKNLFVVCLSWIRRYSSLNWFHNVQTYVARVVDWKIALRSNSLRIFSLLRPIREVYDKFLVFFFMLKLKWYFKPLHF